MTANFREEMAGAGRHLMPSPAKKGQISPRTQGFTLMEVFIAAAVIALTFSAIGVLSGSALRVARSTDRVMSVEANLTSRLDQLRSVGWGDLTDPTYSSALLSGTLSTAPAPNIQGLTKQVITFYPATTGTVSASPAPLTTPYFTVTKDSTGTPVLDTTGTAGISSVRSVWIQVATEWNDGNRTHRREVSTIIAKSAIPFYQ